MARVMAISELDYPTSKRVAVILITGVLVVLGALGFGRFSMSLVLPSMRQGLGLSYTELGTITSANFMGYLSFSLGSGLLASRWGPRRVIAISLMLSSLSMIATGFSNGFWVPLIWMALVGVGTAGANVPVMAMVSSWVSPQRRGLASGLLIMGSGIGLTINGVVIPHWVTQPGNQGWRDVWIWLGIVTVCIAIWAAVALRDRNVHSPAVVGGSGKQPSIWVQMFNVFKQKPVLLRLALVYFAFGFSYVVFTTFFGVYLTETRGWSAFAAGRLWKWVGVFSLPSGFIWGWLSDRIGRRWGLFVVYLMHAGCLVAFATLPWATGITVAALVYGLSIFSIPAIMNAACGDEAGPYLAPTAYGAITVAFGLGQMAAPQAVGVMLDIGWGMVQTLWLSAAVALLGAVGALFLHVPFATLVGRRLKEVDHRTL